MNGAAFGVELLKLRHSRVVWMTTVVLLLLPSLLARAFLWAAEADGRDAMSVKAGALVPGTGWTGYLESLIQIYATAGLLGVGIVVTWCFGREFADRTVVSLYACATPREAVAAAKFAVLGGWALLLSVALGPVALLLGVVTGLGWPDHEAWTEVTRLVVLASLTAMLALTVALFASAGRGYFPAFGGLLGLIVAAQVAVVVGVGGWFPWSAPALWAVSVPGAPPVPGVRLVLVPLTVAGVVLATIVWWRRAELR